MKKFKTISIKDYLTGKGIYFSEKNGELIAKCIFNDCDNDSKGEEAHLYFNSESGQYECKKCGEKGNIFTLAEYLGDDKNKIIIKGKKSTSSKSKKSFPEFVEKCHRQLPNDIREYLYSRGITEDTIERYKIGYGHFYCKNWVTIPIKDKSGNYIFFKLREDPSTGDDKLTYPKGSEAQIYSWEILKKNPKYIVICEGELDRLLLLSKGIQAITSTHGANTFKNYWVDALRGIKKIAVCYKNDERGRIGSTKVLDLLEKNLDSKLYKIVLPSEVGEGGDITDYFIKLNKIKEDLFKKYIIEYPEKIDIKKFKQLNLDEISEILGITIKQDRENKIATFLCMILVYSDSDQLNISYNAPSSTGKSYIPLEIAELFPEEDVIEIGYCSPTAFFHDYGEFDRDFEGYIVDLSKKILIFIDQPHPLLIQHLRPLLSHDRKEILMKITDKTQKYGLKTKNIKLIGFPSVIFCTASLKVNEQEATRFLLLSPETTQDKIKQGVNVSIDNKTDKKEYKNWVEENSVRRLLKERIRAIKNEDIKEIIIKDKETIKKKFYSDKKLLIPRHQRDIGRVISFIKARAIINCFWRERIENAIVANHEDIEEGFRIWDKISINQELSIPPYIYNLYKEILIPAWKDKNDIKDFSGDNVLDGIYRKEIMKKHFDVYGKAISDCQLRQDILPMLETAGLITQEPDPDDKRKILIYPVGLIGDKRNNE